MEASLASDIRLDILRGKRILKIANSMENKSRRISGAASLGLVPLFLSLAAAVSCLNRDLGQFQRHLAEGINRTCFEEKRCLIRLSDYTDFRWDTLYVFPYSTSEARIAEVLGQQLPGWVEFQYHEVFVLDGRIVHQEAFKEDVEKVLPGEVTFALSAGGDFVKLSPDQRVAAEQRVAGGVRYYYVEPTQ